MSAAPPLPAPELGGLLDLARAAAAAGAAVLAGRNAAELGGQQQGRLGGLGDGVRPRRGEQPSGRCLPPRRPQDIITGEEGGTVLPGPASGYRWSVDPLDGTTNFIRNIVYYGTSVAVADPDGVWLAGVVNAPALGRVYYASRGQRRLAGGERPADAAVRTGPRARRADPGHRFQLRSRTSAPNRPAASAA